MDNIWILFFTFGINWPLASLISRFGG